MMRFHLYEDLKSPVKTAVSVSIGQYAMTVEKTRWDRTFQREENILGISPRKMMEAASVTDLESLRDYMMEHFASKSGYKDLITFLVNNNIRHEKKGDTSYE